MEIGKCDVVSIPIKKHEKPTIQNIKSLRVSYDVSDDYSEIERIIQLAYVNLELSKAPLSKPSYPQNYDDLWHRASYGARYFYAYSYEYINLFISLIDLGLPEKKFKVLSLGCGAKIDAWSIQEALRVQRCNTFVHYIGVDKSDWEQDGYCPKVGDGIMIEPLDPCKAGSFMNKNSDIDFDVIFFPKSIGDIYNYDREDFNLIKKAFCLNNYTKDTFYVVSSMIRYTDEKRNDVQALEELVECIEGSGFKCSGCYMNERVSEAISSYKNYVKYPAYPNATCKSVERLTGFFPILTRNYENYIICRFERVVKG